MHRKRQRITRQYHRKSPRPSRSRQRSNCQRPWPNRQEKRRRTRPTSRQSNEKSQLQKSLSQRIRSLQTNKHPQSLRRRKTRHRLTEPRSRHKSRNNTNRPRRRPQRRQTRRTDGTRRITSRRRRLLNPIPNPGPRKH